MLKSVGKAILIFTVISILLTSISLADNGWDMEINPNNNIGDGGRFKEVGRSVINIIRIVGVGIAIIMLIVIAIKFMSSEKKEKAEWKKTLLPYIIGAVILFAASGILQIVYNATEKLLE